MLAPSPTPPSLHLVFSDDGKPLSLAAAGSETNLLRDGSPGFRLRYRDGTGPAIEAAAERVVMTDERLTLQAAGITLVFALTHHERFLVVALSEVRAPADRQVLAASFTLNTRGGGVHALPLDYLTRAGVDQDQRAWVRLPWIWSRNEHRNNASSGRFALFLADTDAAYDETLLHLWADGGLPHPKIRGNWTVERARAWLADWQERFSDQSCLVVGAQNRAELDRLTDWAAKLGMKRIYLHTDTWRGEYWPRQHSYLRVNPSVFPRGEPDLNQYTAGLRAHGMSFAVHSTCISIGMNDPDYVRPGLHPDLARWVRGTLAQPAAASDDTLFFRPATRSRYPQVTRHGGDGPDAMPGFMNLRLFRVGNEIVEVGLVETTEADVWVLRQCRRGGLATAVEAHDAGTTVEGILRGYGQAFVPASGSALFEETIRRWAGFCSRNNVDHLECDALEIHQDRPWGSAEFSWRLSSELTLPSTSNTSSGRPLPFHIEYWFRGSRQVLNNHAYAGVAGGASLPLYRHSKIRVATGPYEILHKPAQTVGRGGNSFNISFPWPMFGVTLDILDNHGLVPVVERLVDDWRTVLEGITSDQRETIAREYTGFRSPIGQAGNQAGTDVLFRPEIVAGERRIVPVRLVGRADGELNWGFGQEFGPIVPRQYLASGDSLRLTNAWSAQDPEFVIRGIGALAEMENDAAAPTGSPAQDESILESYATGTTIDQAVHPLHTARHIWLATAMDQGEAQPGTVTFRREVILPEDAAVKTARLFLQVDDEAVAFVNGRKVFRGGRYDRLLVVPLRNLRPGSNEVLIRATNAGGPGSLAAALHVRLGDATRLVVVTDPSWQGRVEEPDSAEDWGPVTVLAAYGEGVWPRARPESGALRRDLMPHQAPIEPVAGQELVVDGDRLKITCHNEGPDPVIHIDDRPAWPTSVDMSEACGLGCTVTGDGSGAVLVISIEGRGKRDYVIPIDFTGPREITIPSGEVAWGHPRWGWRSHSARFDYRRITGVKVGFGTVPAKTRAEVTVQNIRPLRQVTGDLRDFTIRLGDGQLVVPGLVPGDHYLWYRGGDTVGLYDLNWNRIRELPVDKRDFIVPAGQTTLAVEAEPTGAGATWFECQVFVTDEAMRVVVGEKPDSD